MGADVVRLPPCAVLTSWMVDFSDELLCRLAQSALRLDSR